MVLVPGGTFLMGSDRHYPEEAPAHRVTVDGFWMDRTPVTNRQFRRFVEDTGYTTFAEIAPDPAQYPGALPEMLQPASVGSVLPAQRAYASTSVRAASVMGTQHESDPARDLAVAVRGTIWLSPIDRYQCIVQTARIDTNQSSGVLMSRVQLALNVSDLKEAIDFYSKLFGTTPAKVQPGYANFAIADPPLKLVLMEHAESRGSGVGGALNHLGVEVMDPAEVADASRRLAGEGLDTLDQTETTCCFAVQDKVWVEDPDGAPWEVYTVLADAPAETGIAGDGTCCAATTTGAAACC